MSYGVWSLVIFLTFAVGMLGIWVLLDRGNQASAVTPGAKSKTSSQRDRGQTYPEMDTKRPGAGSHASQQVPGRTQGYGPFPVDTGPLLILSETTAAGVALEREIRLRCAEAEEKIPARWR